MVVTISLSWSVPNRLAVVDTSFIFLRKWNAFAMSGFWPLTSFSKVF